TCDEVWKYLPKMPNRLASVHLAHFPAPDDLVGDGAPLVDEKQLGDWTTLRTVRDDVLKALEEARNAKKIGGSLEAQVTLRAADPMYGVLERYKDELRYVFIVSAVTLERHDSGNGNNPIGVQVSRAAGEKCDRCWNYSTHVGEDAEYPKLC